MGVFKRVRTTQDGKKSAYWYIRYRIKGRLRWESVGKVGRVTKAVAEEFLAGRKRQLRQGRLEELTTTIPTLSEFAEEYIAYSRDVIAKRSWKRDVTALNHLLPLFGDLRLSMISPRDIQDYQERRLKDGTKPATVNRDLAVLGGLFRLARDKRKFFGENPVSRTRALPIHNQVERILTFEEEEKLLAESPPYLYAIIITALNTGMRKSEIISLAWSNVDFRNNVITIEATNTKSKKMRRIPINSALRQTLLKQKLVSGSQKHVFLSSRGKPFAGENSLRKVFNSACERAGIKGLRFHDLRHTAATRMVESGAPLVAVAAILGHQDIRTTMRYAHPTDSLKEAVESLAIPRKYSQKYSQHDPEDS